MTRGAEKQDVDPLALALLGLMLTLCLALGTLATALLYRVFSTRMQVSEGALTPPMPEREKSFPNPQLQTYPTEDLVKFRQKEDAILNGYRWVDKQAGVVGIPIESAIGLLVAQQTLPVLGTPGLPQGPTWTEMMQRRAAEGAQAQPEMKP